MIALQNTMNLADAAHRRVEGPTILLGSGYYYDYEHPEDSLMTIEDVAYGLGFTCRFRGQCVERATGRRVFYSVADHCEIMSRVVPPELAFDALMHEVGETVVGDPPTPLKGFCPEIRVVEKRCEAAGLELFSVPMRDRVLLKRYDLAMMATERRDLMPWNGERWPFLDDAGVEPLPQRIVPRSPEESAAAFLRRFDELKAA